MSDADPRPMAGIVESVERAMAAQRPLAAPASSRDDPDARAEVAAFREQVLVDQWRDRVPRRFATASLDDFEGQLGVDLAGWAADPRPNVLLLGPVGSGKTWASWALLRSVHFRWRRWARAGVSDLLESLRPDRRIVCDVAAEFLVLDDLGAEQASPWTIEQLGRILNTRWEAELPTIVTSNLEPGQLSEWLGERAWSRLASGALVLGVTGADRRFHPSSRVDSVGGGQ